MSRFIKVTNTRGNLYLINIDQISYIEVKDDERIIYLNAGSFTYVTTDTPLEDLEEMLK